MKKAVSVLKWGFLVLLVLPPLGTLLSSCFGYTFELVSVTAFAAVTALLSAGFVVLRLVEKSACEGGAPGVLFALFAPLSLVNAMLSVLANRSIWVIFCVLLCSGCCLFLTVKCGRPPTLRLIALALSVLLLLPVGVAGFFAMIFGNIAQNTVVKTVASPNGAYYAEVIDSDQGALGGDTLVEVYEAAGINALVFKISKKPQRVYVGDWGAFEGMEIYWKDDECLVINGAEYPIE